MSECATMPLIAVLLLIGFILGWVAAKTKEVSCE